MKSELARVLLCLLVLSALLSGCPDRRLNTDDDDDSSGDDDDSSGDDDDSSADDVVDDDDDDDDDDATDSGDDDTQDVDPCESALGGRLSNVGCEFWAVDLDNAENSFDDAAASQFAVAVANVSEDKTAHVEAELNQADPGSPISVLLVEEVDIAPGDLHIFRLPRRDVDGENVTNGVDDGPQTWLSSRAFRIHADAPVVAYQFNTLDQQYSNDASLLLPTNGLGMEHLVVTYPPSGPVGEVLGLPGPANRGYITVVGTEEDTEVEIIPTQDIVAGTGVSDLGGGVGITAGTSRSFTLGPYDVLNLETTLVTDLFSTPENFADLTGSIVNSTAPVAVFTGADLAMITSGFSDSPCCAEHLEQQVLPTRVMRNQFVVSHSAQRNSGDTEPDLVRIMALEAGTSVTTSLDAPDNSFTLGAGEYRELWPTSGFTVDATGPLHVAQFLIVGGDVPSPIAGAGDSSLLYVPPVLQRKNDYVFTTGEGFQSNWAVISMPEGITASLDGAELSTLSGCSGPEPEGSLGTTGYEAWTCSITDGVHRIWSGAGADPGAENIGVLVYGYYAAGSYSYPAGAGLQ